MSLQSVKINISKELLQVRIAKLEALNRRYAVDVINYFLSVQPPVKMSQGKYWFNWTTQAAVRMFARSFTSSSEMGWFISHGIDYGVWLTLANDRRHDALTPIVRKFAGQYLADVKRLFGG